MRGIATIDRQPGSETIAIWVTNREALVAKHTNAVVVDLAADSEAMEKVRSLTRCSVILVTDGTVLDGLPVEGKPLTTADIHALVGATEAHQETILGAVADYKRRTRSSTLKDPAYPTRAESEDFVPTEDTPSARAFATANYVGRAWSAWLQTDDERRRRTARPKTGESPWIMPADLNDAEVAVFPPSFAARLREQALV